MDPEASVNVINVYRCNIDTRAHSRLSEDAWIRRHDCSQTRIMRVGKLDLNMESRWASWFDPAFPRFRFRKAPFSESTFDIYARQFAVE
jgi:hypothetical protein